MYFMLSEISQSKTNPIWFNSYAQFKKTKKQKEEREGQTKKQDLKCRELVVPRGEVGVRDGKQGMGIVQGTCDEHPAIYGSGESLYYTPETNIILYVS